MSFQRVHPFRSQNSQLSSNTSQFSPRPFSIQKSKRPQSQEDVENEAFQQNKFEAFGLQLKERHDAITPVEQERLDVLQAKMGSLWAQRMKQAKAQPNLLEALIHNSQTSQTTESKATAQSNMIQAKGEMTGDRSDSSVEQRSNQTGMPDALKAGVESISGYSLDDVRVHYNSPKPAQLQALAYTQGTEIHVASGQEEHLPHEAWHVVQQAQGRVQPTMQMKGKVSINDDVGLEVEADVMGAKALQATKIERAPAVRDSQPITGVLQAKFSQTAQIVQTEHFGGVKCQYSAPANEIELHIDAGANNNGTLMQDLLIALWASRDTLEAGRQRKAGCVVMHPGGVQVVKMTMEKLAEALGSGPNLEAGQRAKAERKRRNLSPSEGVPEGLENDVLGAPVVSEHLAYRDSLVGARGVSIAPVGGGTMAGDTDMLAVDNDDIRAAYDLAVGQVRHALSLNIRLDLNALKTVITAIESGLKWYQIAALKVKAWR